LTQLKRDDGLLLVLQPVLIGQACRAVLLWMPGEPLDDGTT